MSKIGKKEIVIDGVTVDITPEGVRYSGKYASGLYQIPSELKVEKTDRGGLLITPTVAFESTMAIPKHIKEVWGLHRALLASRLQGAATQFERRIKIVGLGFKALLRGSEMEFSLGYSHKIPFVLPVGVTATVDKTGQKIVLQAADKELVGLVASKMRNLRKPERYKGTGVLYDEEVIVLKAGKTK